MRVLIINGFRDTRRGKSEFDRFRSYVLDAINALQASSSAEFIVRPLDDLADYISPHLRTAAPAVASSQASLRGPQSTDGTRNFDSLDFVFIDGDTSIPPWSPQAADLVELLRMAIASGKCVFACGLGLTALVLACEGPDRPLAALHGSDACAVIAQDTGDFYRVSTCKELAQAESGQSVRNSNGNIHGKLSVSDASGTTSMANFATTLTGLSVSRQGNVGVCSTSTLRGLYR